MGTQTDIVEKIIKKGSRLYFSSQGKSETNFRRNKR